MLKLPGLIDPHVHMREPGGVHKEDWDSGTAAALAGGYTMVLAMPNTQPAVTNVDTLVGALAAARAKARCDYAQYLGAGADNFAWETGLAARAAGLKMYLDQTYGPLRLDDMEWWAAHFTRWPRRAPDGTPRPVVVHAEGRSLAAAILQASLHDCPLHLAHVSRREEILLVRQAKARGLKVTCEVAPHHLFLTEEDCPSLGPGRCEVRPGLARAADRDALWANLDVIDVFASDHAPHALAEKDGPNPPPGFPGLETTLPLLLTAVRAGRLSLEDVAVRTYTNPRRIFGLPEQPETWIEVDDEARATLRAAEMYSRCGWTPFEGWPVRARLARVVLRGQIVYDQGRVLAPPGSGRDIRL